MTTTPTHVSCSSTEDAQATTTTSSLNNTVTLSAETLEKQNQHFLQEQQRKGIPRVAPALSLKYLDRVVRMSQDTDGILHLMNVSCSTGVGVEETVTTSEPGRSVSKDVSYRGSVVRVEVVLVNTYDGTMFQTV